MVTPDSSATVESLWFAWWSPAVLLTGSELDAEALLLSALLRATKNGAALDGAAFGAALEREFCSARLSGRRHRAVLALRGQDLPSPALQRAARDPQEPWAHLIHRPRGERWAEVTAWFEDPISVDAALRSSLDGVASGLKPRAFPYANWEVRVVGPLVKRRRVGRS